MFFVSPTDFSYREHAARALSFVQAKTRPKAFSFLLTFVGSAADLL
jgi:hypothetical protein